MTFNWDRINNELQIRAPYILRIISSIASDIPKQVDGYSIHTLCTVASALHARSSYMSFIQYVVGFVLTHGGCSKRDMERMCSLGFNVSPSSLQRKLTSWHEHLDEEVNNLHRGMMSEKNMRYQLVGDNWDKDLLPSYRTTDRGTISLHLFNVIAVKDRVPCTEEANADQVDLQPSVFMPSLQDQKQLENELVFLISTSIIHHLPALEDLVEVYPTHLNHPFSEYAGIKTEQHPLRLFDCDEKKTTDMIQLLGSLQDKYALLLEDGSVKEPIFFGGNNCLLTMYRLTDERVQTAQEAMKNGGTQKERLEGFISKIEDFHRLMNFLEAIHKQVFSTESSSDRGTLYFFRNLLNARGVKGKVKKSYCEHKMLYYTVLDAICCLLFLKESGMDDPEGDFLFPEEFPNFSNTEKVDWLNDMVRPIVQKYFFDGKSDILSDVREVISDPNHPENYWISNEQNGRLNSNSL
ncbi:hypothetical protein FSP39_009157 [Pinctada imbricata]|uniref:DUF6589 domain-containing protein n=1 Tax=Pinctada imbricata TaxID=66713 RepID=A0AA88YKR5_PINIB|nr:hypothetical protein FSP39_009157 [Pinctada imbricata]